MTVRGVGSSPVMAEPPKPTVTKTATQPVAVSTMAGTQTATLAGKNIAQLQQSQPLFSAQIMRNQVSNFLQDATDSVMALAFTMAEPNSLLERLTTAPQATLIVRKDF